MTERAEGRYVALLRGVNVGNARKISMDDLRRLMVALGFSDARTTLNSGNVVFSATRGAASEISSNIERSLTAGLGIDTRVVVLSAAEFLEIQKDNPLVEIADNPSRLLVAFVSPQSALVRLAPLSEADWSPEALGLGPRAAYLWCPRGTFASPLAQALARELGSAGTTRSWATVDRIASLLVPGSSSAHVGADHLVE